MKFQKLRAVSKFKFFAHQNSSGLAFEYGTCGVIKASFDLSFREVMFFGRPQRLHLPELFFDGGIRVITSGSDLNVVPCERLSAVQPLSSLCQLGYDLNQALEESLQESRCALKSS